MYEQEGEDFSTATEKKLDEELYLANMELKNLYGKEDVSEEEINEKSQRFEDALNNMMSFLSRKDKSEQQIQ